MIKIDLSAWKGGGYEWVFKPGQCGIFLSDCGSGSGLYYGYVLCFPGEELPGRN